MRLKIERGRRFSRLKQRILPESKQLFNQLGALIKSKCEMAYGSPVEIKENLLTSLRKILGLIPRGGGGQ